MQLVVIGHDLSSDARRDIEADSGHWGGGRYWSVETYYLYTLLWDPFILCRTSTAPSLCDTPIITSDRIAETTLVFARPSAASEEWQIADVLKCGGHVALQHPSARLLATLRGPAVADKKRPCLISLRERWNLGSAATRAYYYPDQQPFLRLVPGNDMAVLSRIGGNPDLILTDHLAVWAGNALSAIVTYTNMPGVLSQMLGDLARLFTQVIGRFVKRPLTDDELRRMAETFELRRDFHALGFAYLTVQELARCHGRQPAGISEVGSMAIDAATELAAGNTAAAQQRMVEAFESLARVNRSLQPQPAVFTDTLHGGELYPDIGYFEIDWPQHPADVLRTYLHWAKTRSYRFNVDFGATTVREMALRYPDLFEELKVAQDHQVVEFVNGSCNQPYPPLHSLESQIRQFDVGQQVWRDVFGRCPQTYASQEFGLCPQLAAVLKQHGYRQAVVRVQNMGDAPTIADAEQIEWLAPSGDGLRALPSHPHKSEQLNCFTYNNLHLKLYLHGTQSPPGLPAVFTCLGDITYHRPMREELARVCHYAPVFGSFATFGQYFDATSDVAAPRRRLQMRDFNCDAGFLNIDLWSVYTASTGNFNTNCMRSLAATHLFAAAEFIDGAAAVAGSSSRPPSEAADMHDAHWEALAHYQGHGTYIVPNYPSGAFLGGIDSPRSKQAGQGIPNVPEYVGPFSPKLMKDVTGPLMDAAERSAHAIIQRRLQQTISSRDDTTEERMALYNFAPARQCLVTLRGLAGRALTIGDKRLPGQDAANDRLALVELPSYGCAVVESVDSDRPSVIVDDPVTVGPDHLENAAVRIEFDLATGTIQRFWCKRTGAELLGSESHTFYCPASEAPRCRGARVLATGPLRGEIQFDIDLPVKGAQACLLRTRVWLDSGQSVLEFETRVLSAPELTGNQWLNHLGVRFAVPDAQSQIHACHFNVLEPHDGEQLISPNVLLAQRECADVGVVFLNEGNEFYLCQGTAISNILVVQNEQGRRFRYAVGPAGANPLMQGRLWVQPVIAVPISGNGDTVVKSPGTRLEGDASVSFVSFDSPDVELLSCRWKDGRLRARVANTTGRPVRARMSTFLPIAEAEQTSLDGRHVADETCRVDIVDEQNSIMLSLRPWDIRQLSIRVREFGAARQLKPAMRTSVLQKV